jgi:hypothetical protein
VAHIWIVGQYAHERAAAAAEIGLPELVPPINAHRRSRGPYTMAGTIIRQLAPQLLELCLPKIRSVLVTRRVGIRG